MMRLPDNRVTGHPGRLLRVEFLEPMGVGQNEFARHIGVQPNVLAGICAEKHGLSPEMCFKLGEALGTGPEMWGNLQIMHDLTAANMRRKRDATRVRITRLRPARPAAAENRRRARTAAAV